ncbi:hypothetical protein [Halobacillus halophilus]|uniref:hypothetical protein n=1 Tax=Halobacillus halophilus TaxID=1570 RepID=UPI001CD2D9CA|nr:hypothetical protein [Halobacillus halophilus]MCA1010973.1 hypothetical protein [Halobacillus halophilus]
MKRDKNTFSQKQWSNPNRSRRKLTTTSSSEFEDDFIEAHREPHTKEKKSEARNHSKKNNIYSPHGKEELRPVISSPPEVFDQEIKEISEQEKIDGRKTKSKKKKADSASEMRKRLSSNRREYFNNLKKNMALNDHETAPPMQEDLAARSNENEFGWRGKMDPVKKESFDHNDQGGSFLKEFISMLGESPSMEISSQSLEQKDSEQENTFGEDYSMLKDIVSSIEKESSNEYVSFKNHYVSQMESSQSAEIYHDVHQDLENNPPPISEQDLYKEISYMLKESSAESSNRIEELYLESSSSLDQEFSLSRDEYEEDPIIHLTSILPLSNGFSDILEREFCPPFLTTNLNEIENLSEKDLQEVSSNEFEQTIAQADSIIGEDKQHLLIKVPVVLARLNIDIHIMESLNLMDGIFEVLNLDCKLQSVNTHVLPHSSTVFLSGILSVDIHYVSDPHKRTVKILKQPISWDKVMKVKWIKLPELSKTEKETYSFASDNGNESTHYEYNQDYASPITDQLLNSYFVWHTDSAEGHGARKGSLQGSAQIRIDLLQEQYIPISL